jgi:hypothetical protein
MSFVLFTDEPCPKCQRPIGQTTIDPHPSIPALQIYACADCGPIKTKMISLTPRKSSPKKGSLEEPRPR